MSPRAPVRGCQCRLQHGSVDAQHISETWVSTLAMMPSSVKQVQTACGRSTSELDPAYQPATEQLRATTPQYVPAMVSQGGPFFSQVWIKGSCCRQHTIHRTHVDSLAPGYTERSGQYTLTPEAASSLPGTPGLTYLQFLGMPH
jgi:hypothetical protein